MSASGGRRAAAWLGGFAGCLGLLLAYSARLPASAPELFRLAGVERCQAVVRDVAARGLEALATPAALGAYDSFQQRQTVLELLGAWSALSVGRVGLTGELTSARLPWLVLGATGVLAIAATTMASRTRRSGVLAAAVLMACGPWLALVASSEAGALGASWACVIALHALALAQPARAAALGAFAAAALAFAVALAPQSLWLVPLLALHARSRREPGDPGWLTVPLGAALGAVLSPIALWLLNPGLWQAGAPALVRLVLSEWGRPIASKLGLSALPLPLLLCAAVGAAVVIAEALARRFATGRFRPADDPVGLARLIALIALIALVVPALPWVALLLPWLGCLAAIGLERLGAGIADPRARVALQVVVVAAIATSALR